MMRSPAVAFDSDPEEINALEVVLKGLILQDPYGMGYDGVMSAYDAINGNLRRIYQYWINSSD